MLGSRWFPIDGELHIDTYLCIHTLINSHSGQACKHGNLVFPQSSCGGEITVWPLLSFQPTQWLLTVSTPVKSPQRRDNSQTPAAFQLPRCPFIPAPLNTHLEELSQTICASPLKGMFISTGPRWVLNWIQHQHGLIASGRRKQSVSRDPWATAMSPALLSPGGWFPPQAPHTHKSVIKGQEAG